MSNTSFDLASFRQRVAERFGIHEPDASRLGHVAILHGLNRDVLGPKFERVLGTVVAAARVLCDCEFDIAATYTDHKRTGYRIRTATAIAAQRIQQSFELILLGRSIPADWAA